MDIRQGIISTAQSLGIDPLDLATAISYETAGTFDPTKAGPTTKWGQHRGLIQFGEPQAQQYGVDWDNPIGSQLGENGAVAKYLRDTGVKEGMGLLDVYSAINAGGVGRYDRSDTAAGGAAGTVADKVRDQMHGHRAKAEQLLGSYHVSSKNGPAERVSKVAKKSSGLLGNLIGDDRRDRLIMALEGMTLNPNQALIQSAGQGIQQRREQAASSKQKNATADWLEGKGRADLANGVRTGAIPAGAALQQAMAQPSDDRTALQKNYQYALAQGMTPQEARQWVSSGTSVTVQTGDKSSQYGEAPSGTAWVLDEAGGHVMEDFGGVQRPKTVPLGGTEAEKRTTDIQKTGVSSAAAADRAQDSMNLIESVITDPSLPQITGMVQGRIPPLTQSGTDLGVKIEQLQGQAFLQAFESLKGGGQITEREGIAAQNAMARLQRAQSTEAFQASLQELYDIMERGKRRALGESVPEDGQDVGDGFSITGVIE